MMKSCKNIKQNKTLMSLPYKGKNEFIALNRWILENISHTVHINVDLSRRSIDLIVNNNEDAMTIFINWY